MNRRSLLGFAMAAPLIPIATADESTIATEDERKRAIDFIYDLSLRQRRELWEIYQILPKIMTGHYNGDGGEIFLPNPYKK
jgi:hypothetical protein